MSFSRSGSIWAHLPGELIAEIFLHVAHESLRDGFKLRLVSIDVNKLVLPMLFEQVVFTSPLRIKQFTEIIKPRVRWAVLVTKFRSTLKPTSLSSYNIRAMALVLRQSYPSIETALESLAPAFNKLETLAISSKLLAANAHWMRRHPFRPIKLMLLHHGCPQTVNFREPFLQSVTHLYSSTLDGHYNKSCVLDLPLLSHLSIQTRIDVPPILQQSIATIIRFILSTSSTIQSIVLCLNPFDLADPLLKTWTARLQHVLEDKRFHILPYQRSARLEWRDIIAGRPDIWERAATWESLDSLSGKKMHMCTARICETFNPPPRKHLEGWELDLVQHPDYRPFVNDPAEHDEFPR